MVKPVIDSPGCWGRNVDLLDAAAEFFDIDAMRERLRQAVVRVAIADPFTDWDAVEQKIGAILAGEHDDIARGGHGHRLFGSPQNPDVEIKYDGPAYPPLPLETFHG